MAWPAGFYASEFRFWQDHAQSRSESPFSFQHQTYTWSGVRWMAEITLPPMKDDRADTFDAFLASLQGTAVLVTFAAIDVAPGYTAGPTTRDWFLSPESPRALRRLPEYASGITLTFLEAV